MKPNRHQDRSARPPAAQTPKSGQQAAKPAPVASPALQQEPTVEDLFNGVKLGRPRSWWRFGNRVYSWATRQISLDEWETICETVRSHLDGKTMAAEDAAEWSRHVISAMCDRQVISTAVASCDRSDTVILVAYAGRPGRGLFFSRSLKLRDPKGLKHVR